MKRKEFIRHLRSNQTDAEKHLWQLLRNRNLARYRFRRQYRIVRFIVDFICLKQRLIIEIDGDQHMDQHEYDEHRTAYLETLGFKVLRFWNNEVLKNTEEVLNKIESLLLSATIGNIANLSTSHLTLALNESPQKKEVS